jgi:hypothetical protein
MMILKINKTFLFMLCFVSFYNSAFAADIVGKWTVTIEDIDERVSIITNTIEFLENGHMKSVSIGMLASKKNRADYRIIEKGTWHIIDGYLFITRKESWLDRIEGDPQLMAIIKELYGNGFKDEVIDSFKILKMDEQNLVLLVEYDNGDSRKGHYKKAY